MLTLAFPSSAQVRKPEKWKTASSALLQVCLTQWKPPNALNLLKKQTAVTVSTSNEVQISIQTSGSLSKLTPNLDFLRFCYLCTQAYTCCVSLLVPCQCYLFLCLVTPALCLFLEQRWDKLVAYPKWRAVFTMGINGKQDEAAKFV